jgi:hypothetical protein
MYNSTLSLTSALDGVGDQRHALSALPGTHCIGGWEGLRAGLDDSRKSRPTGIRSPDRPTHSQSLYHLGYPGSPLLPFISVFTSSPSS